MSHGILVDGDLKPFLEAMVNFGDVGWYSKYKETSGLVILDKEGVQVKALRAFFNHQLESQVRNSLKQEGKNEEEISARLEYLKSGKIEVSVLKFLFKEALQEIKEEEQQQHAFQTFLDIFHLINKIFFYIPDPFTNERNGKWVLVPYNVTIDDQKPELWTGAEGEKEIVSHFEFYSSDPLPPSLLSDCIIRSHKLSELYGTIKESYFFDLFASMHWNNP
jgi:hypothetical protein